MIFLQQQEIHDGFTLSTILADAKRVKNYILALTLALIQLVGIDVDREIWIQLFKPRNISRTGWKIDPLHPDVSAITCVMTLSVGIGSVRMQLCVNTINNASTILRLDIDSGLLLDEPKGCRNVVSPYQRCVPIEKIKVNYTESLDCFQRHIIYAY